VRGGGGNEPQRGRCLTRGVLVLGRLQRAWQAASCGVELYLYVHKDLGEPCEDFGRACPCCMLAQRWRSRPVVCACAGPRPCFLLEV
jgi:hypothetical protein